MARSSRFSTPALRPNTLPRPRLLRVLADRWERGVTLVVGGAGLGKTTLLTQAVTENLMAPRGDDVWVALEPGDGDGRLATVLLDALGAAPRPDADARTVADAMWQRSPAQVCLVLDDVHLLEPHSPGHAVVADLARSLPSNGHLVVSSRTDPQLPLARALAAGHVAIVTEAELRFDRDELRELAALRGVDDEVLAVTGGWPAMAELMAQAGTHAVDYLWQEVIEPLGRDRRRILAAVIDLGGGDDALLSAAFDEPVHLATALDGVPLISVVEGGWYRPHDLWRPMARLRLTAPERLAARRRAARHLVRCKRYDDAFDLIAETPLWDEAEHLFRAACIEQTRHPSAGQLRRWLSATPEEVQQRPAGLLARGVLAVLTRDPTAVELTRAAMVAFRGTDLDAELGAILHLGRAAWWNADFDVLADLEVRVDELCATGHPTAAALSDLGRALYADLAGDDRAVLDALENVDTGALGPAWAPTVEWMRAAAYYGLGDVETTRAITTAELGKMDDPVLRVTLEALRWAADWQLGNLVTEQLTRAQHVDAGAATGVRYNAAAWVADLSRWLSHVGEADQAAGYLQRVQSELADDRPVPAVRAALAAASLALHRGDEGAAAATLREARARYDLLASTARRAWRDGLCLTYVLVPETRDQWDAIDLAGCWRHARELARAVVDLREGTGHHLDAADVADVAVVRNRLHHRFAAELAIGLQARGRPEAASLLDAIGPLARETARAVAADRSSRLQAAAQQLLAAVPPRPAGNVELGVLGPSVVRRDGVAVDEPRLRRERVRALLAYLVVRRRAERAEIADALWPDLDERAAANNLRVTLNHVIAVLEPWRREGDPSYFVRTEGRQLVLVTRDSLRIDLDEFENHLEAAAGAEGDGAPSIALERYLAAVALWRGEPFGDVRDAEWLDLERERARIRYLAALNRAAQLLAGRDELDRADDLAGRALDTDPWSEPAHVVLITTALARGDRSAAKRAFDRCSKAMAELGVEPSPDTLRLARRISSP